MEIIEDEELGVVVPIYEWHELPLDRYGESGTCNKGKVNYLNEVCAFDIETCTVLVNGQAVGYMYIWQFCIENDVAMGRTWASFLHLYNRLIEHFVLSEQKRLVVYVHNLGFEMQFLSSLIPVNDVFAPKPHYPISFLSDGLEFRCSWKLSNMGLSKFTDKTPGVTFKKRSGKNFDYREIRNSATKLSDQKLMYCYCDVRGLVQAIHTRLNDGYTLATIPKTSTGYVRSKAREAMKRNPKNRDLLVTTALSVEQYAFCRQARRGGNTHANYLYAGKTIHIRSKDKKSSYPAQMLYKDYPMGKFAEFSHNIKAIDKWACLLDVTLEDIHIKKGVYIPYIPASKIINLPSLKKHAIFDNGRLVQVDKGSNARIMCTDVDFKIIERTYDFKLLVNNILGTEYGKLPKELRYCVLDDFGKKCELELKGDRYLYDKFKNQLNSYFGMMLTDIIHDENPFNAGEWLPSVKPDPYKAIDKYYSSYSSFLAYQWGLWVTAHARDELQEAIDGLGIDIVYLDTDSAKYLRSHDDLFARLNAKIISQCENNDIPAYYDRSDGKRIYLGLWEDEGEMDFKTFGAKKYACEKNGKFEITVAGLSKQDGADYIKSLANFKTGLEIPPDYSGRTIAKYNVVDKPYWIDVDGCPQLIINNVAIVDTSYRLNITPEYADYIGDQYLLADFDAPVASFDYLKSFNVITDYIPREDIDKIPSI